MKQSQRAFSLLEILCLLALLSASSAFFWGSGVAHFYSAWRETQQLTQQTETLLRSIERARLLAMNSGQQVFMCGGKNCDGHWSDSIYLTHSLSGAFVWQRSFIQQTRIRWRGFPVQRDFIIFLASGLSSYQNGSFYLCVGDSEAHRVIINQSGRGYLDQTLYSSEECL